MTLPDASTIQNQFPLPLTRLGGDVDIFVELAEVVLEDAPPELVVLRGHLEKRHLPAVATSAHRLKGMLSTFDDDTLTPKMQRLIDTAHAQDDAAVAAAAEDALAEADQLIAQLRQAIGRSEPS